MAITLKVPIVVDAALLSRAMLAAHHAGTHVKLETFYRIVGEEQASAVDCDTAREVLAYVSHAFQLPATDAEARAAGERMVEKHRAVLDTLADHNTAVRAGASDGNVPCVRSEGTSETATTLQDD